MARPSTIRDETIIEAAREVFLARGIRATTAEVAERAGISEGTIFNRFKSKVELFQAAMRSQIEALEWAKSLPGRVGKGEVPDSLVALGLEIVQFFRTVTPLMMMSWSNPGTDGLPAFCSDPEPPPLRALKRVAGYFEAESRLGRIRRHDPEIVARAFLGGLQSFVFFELLLKQHEGLPLPAETFVRGHVNLLWAGLAPSPS